MPQQRRMAADSVVDLDGLKGIIANGSEGSVGGLMLSDLSFSSLQGLAALERLVEQEFLLAAAHARMICDLHWENMRDEQEARGEPALLHTRARVINGSLQAVWMKASGPVKLGNKEKRYIAREIPKGTGRESPKYTKRIYTGLSAWERELVEYTEGHYEKQRERALITAKWRRLLKRHRQLVEDSYEDYR